MKMCELEDGEMGLVLSNPMSKDRGIQIVQCNIRGAHKDKHFQTLGATEGKRWEGKCTLEVRKLTDNEIENIRQLIANPYGNTKTLKG